MKIKTLLFSILMLVSVRATEKLIIDFNQRVLVTNSCYKYHILWESRDLSNWNIVGIVTNNVWYTRVGRQFTQIYYYTTPYYCETEPDPNNPLIIFFFDNGLKGQEGILGVFENPQIPGAGEILALKNDDCFEDDWPWRVARVVKKHHNRWRIYKVYLTFP